RVGKTFADHKGVKEGDLVFLEHYLPCGHCEWDRIGEYRHCAATEWFYDHKAIRYGYTSIDIAPGLWGGFSHYLYLPLNAVLHRVPNGLTSEEAGVATPMSNGVQWALLDGGAGCGATVLIQGPEPQGLCCGLASRAGGTMVVQGEGNQEFPTFPIGRVRRKGITLKSARGHSYRAVERALRQLASHRFPLDLMMTHTFGLTEVDYAIKSVGGHGATGAI